MIMRVMSGSTGEIFEYQYPENNTAAAIVRKVLRRSGTNRIIQDCARDGKQVTFHLRGVDPGKES